MGEGPSFLDSPGKYRVDMGTVSFLQNEASHSIPGAPLTPKCIPNSR